MSDLISCPTCGSTVEAGKNFCGDCGTRLGVACPACGADAKPGQRFCNDCGTALSDLAGPQPKPVESAPAPIDAERRLVSVLFLDIAGFTPFTESRDAEDVRDFITRYFDQARQVIERFGGTVDKYIGDAVMALWGATRAEEDDAERAVRAGLELVDMVAKMGAEEGITDMSARAGIMTGEASVGPGGNDTGLVLGDIVNTASRLQSIGEPGDVLVGETTKQLTSRSIAYADVGERALKGKDEVVAVFRADHLLAERGGAGRADMIEAPFVGRDEELRLLKDQLHATTREQRAKLVSIVGQAGIGKSRLIWEFLKYVDGLVETIYWHHGRAPSYSDGIAMWSLAEMVRSRCGISETEEPESARRLLGEKLGELFPTDERAWVEPQLSVLLGLDPGTGERSELHAAIRLFFEKLSVENTTVLVFEDLHWADAATLDFVEEFTEWSRDHPILVVALARPDLLEQRPTWSSLQRGVVSLHLPPLAQTDMHRLVASLVPAFEAPTRSRIVDPSGGVPLFAIEMIRMLLADGTLTPNDDGTFSPATTVTDLAVPDSVQAVIGARLDRLDREDRHLVQDAAILGQTFTVSALSALTEIPESELAGRLATLARRELFELIRDPRSTERGQYGFVQSLIREVAQGRVARDTRRDKHLRVARYLEGLDAEDVAGAVAFHYLEAVGTGAADPAILEATMSALTQAVQRAREVHSYEQIVSLTERAERIIDDGAILAPLWVAAADAASAQTNTETAERFAQRLFDHHSAAGDEAGIALALGVWGEVLNESGKASGAVELLEPHFAATDDPPVTEGHARFYAALARAQMLSGNEKTVTTASQALFVAEQLDLEEVAVQAMITKGTRLTDERRPREGRALIASGTAIAKEHGLTSAYLRGLANSAYSSRSLKEGKPVLFEGFAEAKRVGERRHIHFFASQVASILASEGRAAEIERMMDDPVIASAEYWATVQLWTALALGRLVLGDREGAQDATQRARQAAAGNDDVQTEMAIHMAEVNSLVFEGRLTEVRDKARELTGENAFNTGNVLSVVWPAFLTSSNRSIVEEFLEWTAVLPSQSWLSGFRVAGEAVAAILDGEMSAGLRTSDLAIAELLDARLLDGGVVMLAIVASHLPEGPERAKLTARRQEILSETPLPGVAAITERILAGEFLAD